MPYRHFSFVSGLMLLVSFAEGPVAAQSQGAPARAITPGTNWTPPRTAGGQPDFQGVWANNSATPLERPKELAGRALLTDEEVAALKKKAAELFAGTGDAAFGDDVYSVVLASLKGAESGPHKKADKEFDSGTGDYSSVWIVPRDWDNRTSLITDPSDGRMPALTPGGQQRTDAMTAALNRPPEGPEDRDLSERCISFGSPQLLAGYQSYYQIQQTSDSVIILTEMIHDARVIPLDGRPHLPAAIRQWLGDSRGHWEGDTLVVDTTNYKSKSFMAASDKLHVIERFSRVGPETLNYEITIDDPETWTKPWSLMIPLKRSSSPVLEYACHEGNIGLEGILAGARAEEQAAAASVRGAAK